MDAVKSFFIWPVVTIFQYVRFSVGAIVCLPVILLTQKWPKDFFALYKSLASLPFGKHVFSGIVYFYAPYTSSICGIVDKLNETTCEVYITDLPWLHNPYSSIHAVALANLGEFSSGLLMISCMQRAKSLRGIPVRINTEYMKKARGTIRAVSEAPDLAAVSSKRDVIVTSTMYDGKGEVVAKTFVTWAIDVRG